MGGEGRGRSHPQGQERHPGRGRHPAQGPQEEQRGGEGSVTPQPARQAAGLQQARPRPSLPGTWQCRWSIGRRREAPPPAAGTPCRLAQPGMAGCMAARPGTACFARPRCPAHLRQRPPVSPSALPHR